MFTQQMQQQGMVSSKELSYITDCLKNEDLLAKMAAQAISNCHTPQLKQKVTQIAQDRLQLTDQLLRTLQQHTQLAH